MYRAADWWCARGLSRLAAAYGEAAASALLEALLPLACLGPVVRATGLLVTGRDLPSRPSDLAAGWACALVACHAAHAYGLVAEPASADSVASAVERMASFWPPR